MEVHWLISQHCDQILELGNLGNRWKLCDAESDKVVMAADGWLVSALSPPVRNGHGTTRSNIANLRNH